MLKIVVISDTHSYFDPLNEVLMKEPYADYYFHLGDIGGSQNNIGPFAAVKGNCDAFTRGIPLFREIETPLGKIRLEHKPLTRREYEKLSNEGYIAFLHGHTHKKENTSYGNLHVLCPGSCSFPRDGSASYLVIRIDERSETPFQADFHILTI